MTETLSPILADDLERDVRRLLERAVARDMSLATAESCTGGLLASLLTDVDGASSAFDRGFVVYSREAKCELLGVAAEDIDRCGAVSSEVAVAMAAGALAASNADLVLSITGFAGQAGDDDEPGLVHFACRGRGGRTVTREEHFGDIGRGAVRTACLRVAVAMLADALG